MSYHTWKFSHSINFNVLGRLCCFVTQNLIVPEVFGGLWGQGIWNQELPWTTLAVGKRGIVILNAARQPSFRLFLASCLGLEKRSLQWKRVKLINKYVINAYICRYIDAIANHSSSIYWVPGTENTAVTSMKDTEMPTWNL